MSTPKTFLMASLAVLATLVTCCAAPKVDFGKIQRPDQPSELKVYDVFVGHWDFKAELINAEGQDREWSGSANWQWTLDDRFLHGAMSAKSARAGFDAAGVWGWDSSKKTYVWWMFNDWGYVQNGPARYDAAKKEWTMNYVGTGLDGTTSYGCYRITVVDHDNIDWHMQEWADVFHGVTKMEMQGSYKRQK